MEDSIQNRESGVITTTRQSLGLNDSSTDMKERIIYGLLHINIVGTAILCLILLIDSGNKEIFKYWDIVFPLDMPFYSTMVFNFIYIVE